MTSGFYPRVAYSTELGRYVKRNSPEHRSKYPNEYKKISIWDRSLWRVLDIIEIVIRRPVGREAEFLRRKGLVE